MAKKQGSILGVVLVLCVIAAVVFGVYWLTDGCFDDIKTFSVKHNGNLYVKNTDGLHIADGDNVAIYSGAKQYEVQIYSKLSSEDFNVTVGSEVYSWNTDIAGKDFTNCFNIVKNDNGFIVNYASLPEILTVYMGRSATVVSKGEFFDLYITSGGSVIRLGFNIVCNANKVEIDNSVIAF